MAGSAYRGTVTYQVPVTAGQYAPDTFGMLGPRTAVDGALGVSLTLVTVLVQSIVTGSGVELWLLDPTPGVDPTSLANYTRSSSTWSVVGANTVPLTGWAGALVRVKSGGTLGTTTVSYSAT